jgi:transcriptional regulator with XRE-family HTH domain
MDLVFIDKWIKDKKDSGIPNQEIADRLGIQSSMVSKYTQIKRLPSIHVAKNIFLLEGIAIHPYSIESIIFEIGDE